MNQRNARRVTFEKLDDVPTAEDSLGHPVPKEQVRSTAHSAGYLARDCTCFTAEASGFVDHAECSGSRVGLNDDRCAGQHGLESVSIKEHSTRGNHTWRRLGDEQSVLTALLQQLRVIGRIRTAETVCQDHDRAVIINKCGLVSYGVNSVCSARDDDAPIGDQVP